MPFDKGKKRRLIDNCGHERCYSCMFTNESCPLCSINGTTIQNGKYNFFFICVWIDEIVTTRDAYIELLLYSFSQPYSFPRLLRLVFIYLVFLFFFFLKLSDSSYPSVELISFDSIDSSWINSISIYFLLGFISILKLFL